MKQTVRSNVFETNSSSIHSLALCKEPLFEEPVDLKEYTAEIGTDGEFGWGLEYITDPIAKLKYLYLMAMEFKMYRGDSSYLNRLKKKFPKVFFLEPNPKDEYLEGYIDHATDKEELFQEMLRDADSFINRGVLILHNDNTDYSASIEKYLKKHGARIVARGGN